MTDPSSPYASDPSAPADPADPSSPPAPTPLRPVAEPERIFGLDALRGVALLGIFFVNVQLFAMPLMHALDVTTLRGTPLSERLAWSFVKAFGEFKWISTFSLLFGAGMAMQLLRATRAGRSFPYVFLRRLAVLAVFGAAHALLFWYGDILFLYAVLGLLLLALGRCRPRTLVIVAVVLLAISSTILTGATALQVWAYKAQAAAQIDQDAAEPAAEPAAESAAESGDATAAAPPPAGFEAMTAGGFDPNSEAWKDGELRAYRDGPFGDAFTFRSITWLFLGVNAVIGFGWRVVGMFVIGAALMKSGFFRPERRPVQGRMMAWGLGLGLPLELVATSMYWATGFEYEWSLVAAAFLHDVGSVALCLGAVGAVTWLSSGGVRGLLRPVANAGRMALTVYLGETIITTTLMYWYGGGWFGSVSRLGQLGLVVAIYAILVVFATLWLIPFRMGPFEWLWRSLTYLRPQPLLRSR